MNEQLFTPLNLTDRVSARILATVAEDPEKEYYQREIARLAGISVGATSQKLRKISDDGLVTVRKSGRMMFYRYNLDNPAARQFKILLNINALHSLVEEIRADAKRIVLFGSCAEGTNVRSSDIDLLIISQDRKRITSAMRRYGARLNRKISPLVMSATEFRQLRSNDKPLYERISRGIPLWQST